MKKRGGEEREREMFGELQNQRGTSTFFCNLLDFTNDRIRPLNDTFVLTKSERNRKKRREEERINEWKQERKGGASRSYANNIDESIRRDTKRCSNLRYLPVFKEEPIDDLHFHRISVPTNWSVCGKPTNTELVSRRAAAQIRMYLYQPTARYWSVDNETQFEGCRRDRMRRRSNRSLLDRRHFH